MEWFLQCFIKTVYNYIPGGLLNTSFSWVSFRLARSRTVNPPAPTLKPTAKSSDSLSLQKKFQWQHNHTLCWKWQRKKKIMNTYFNQNKIQSYVHIKVEILYENKKCKHRIRNYHIFLMHLQFAYHVPHYHSYSSVISTVIVISICKVCPEKFVTFHSWVHSSSILWSHLLSLILLYFLCLSYLLIFSKEFLSLWLRWQRINCRYGSVRSLNEVAINPPAHG